MFVSRIEALADAISALNDWLNPSSDAYQLRNPGLLRAFSTQHLRDEHGRRIFPSSIDGIQALKYDLTKKCSGNSRSKLKDTSTLKDLLVKGYAQPPSSEEYVLCFLQSALLRQSINANTPLKYFLEEVPNGRN